MTSTLALPIPVLLPDHTRSRRVYRPLIPVRAVANRPAWQPPPPRRSAPSDQLQVIVAVLETLFGRRPLHQVGRLLNDHAFAVLQLQRQSGRWNGASIASVRTQEPHRSAAEVSVRLVLDGRSLACAMRLDRTGGKWQCSDIQLPG